MSCIELEIQSEVKHKESGKSTDTGTDEMAERIEFCRQFGYFVPESYDIRIARQLAEAGALIARKGSSIVDAIGQSLFEDASVREDPVYGLCMFLGFSSIFGISAFDI